MFLFVGVLCSILHFLSSVDPSGLIQINDWLIDYCNQLRLLLSVCSTEYSMRPHFQRKTVRVTNTKLVIHSRPSVYYRMILRSKGQRSRSQSYQVRYRRGCAGQTTARCFLVSVAQRPLVHIYGTGRQLIYGSVIVSHSLNGCWRLICLVLENAVLRAALVRSAVYNSAYLPAYLWSLHQTWPGSCRHDVAAASSCRRWRSWLTVATVANVPETLLI